MRLLTVAVKLVLTLGLGLGLGLGLAAWAVAPSSAVAAQAKETEKWSWAPTPECRSPVRLCYEGDEATLERVVRIDVANPCRKHATLTHGSCTSKGFPILVGNDPVFSTLTLWRAKPRHNGTQDSSFTVTDTVTGDDGDGDDASEESEEQMIEAFQAVRRYFAGLLDVGDEPH